MSDISGDDEIAFMDLKSKIVKLMFEFTEKYAGPESNLYADCGYILVDVLTNCLEDAQYQVCDYMPFTIKQRDQICYQIGDWYFKWKSQLTDPYVPHRLGVAKEQLKTIICGE